MTKPSRPIRVVVVAPIMIQYDAISLAARDTVRLLSNDPRFEVFYLGCACDFPEINHRLVGDVADLLLDPAYQSADVAIFHFGLAHGLFDALSAAGPPVRIVRFHNVTPARFVPPAEHPLIERSLRQIQSFKQANEIWADSEINARDLIDRGFSQDKIRVIPLVVEDPETYSILDKPSQSWNILYVGRISAAKGLHDLVEAIARVDLPRKSIKVRVIGNTTWSDPKYVAKLRTLITDLDLHDTIEFTGTVDDIERDRLFHWAHILAIPSYHEGFCRPVIEGLRAGCIPVVYDAYNLPFIAADLGRVTPAGDVEAYAQAIRDVVLALPAALDHPEASLLPIDRGPTSAMDFHGLARRYAKGFGFEVIAEQTRDRILALFKEKISNPSS